MSLIDDAHQKLGSLFITGFKGLELSEDTEAFLSQAGIGGVILFSENYENPGQVAELINQIQTCRKALPFWITVDHEGGKVQRFKKHFTKIPEAREIGKTDSPKVAFEMAKLMAKELKAVGVNVNFCPVADILTNPKNPVMSGRAYGDNEPLVSKMVSGFVRGHLVEGVQPCIKHFPGHGDTSKDSHFALPVVNTTLETMLNREFRPFTKASKSRCQMIMTAHIICKEIDPEFPATCSKKILRGILRKDLRYSRIIISDDMEMKAITDKYGFDEAPRLALEAGCDLLIYRSEDAARKAYSSLMKALESQDLAPEIVLEAAARVETIKKEALMPYNPINISDIPKNVGIKANEDLVAELMKING